MPSFRPCCPTAANPILNFSSAGSIKITGSSPSFTFDVKIDPASTCPPTVSAAGLKFVCPPAATPVLAAAQNGCPNDIATVAGGLFVKGGYKTVTMSANLAEQTFDPIPYFSTPAGSSTPGPASLIASAANTLILPSDSCRDTRYLVTFDAGWYEFFMISRHRWKLWMEQSIDGGTTWTEFGRAHNAPSVSDPSELFGGSLGSTAKTVTVLAGAPALTVATRVWFQVENSLGGTGGGGILSVILGKQSITAFGVTS